MSCIVSKRSVSFVDHFQLQVGGKINQQCIVLNDVDNDGCNELVLATESK